MSGTIASRQQKANQICYETWVRQDQLSHKQRLKNSTTLVDTKAPPVYAHLIHRSKKEQMLEERYTRIEHENRLLLKKMSKIMRTNSLDNLQKPMKVERTLNAGLRKRELKKIMDENQAILRRIQNRKPYYQRDDFNNHALRHEIYRTNIREKPSRTLPTLLQDPRAKSAPERGRTKLLAPLKKKSPKARASPTRVSPKTSASPKAKRSPGKKGKKAGANKLSKGGFNIGGQYLIVTVEEHKSASDHQIKFITYDVDEGASMDLMVDFATIEECAPVPLLAKGKRSELSDLIVRRLKITDGKLEFDSSADWRPTTGVHAQPKSSRGPAAKKEAKKASKPKVVKEEAPAKEEAPEKEEEPKKTEAAETSIGLKLKLASALEAPIDASFHLYVGDTLVSKTEVASGVTEGEKAFETAIALKAPGSDSLQVRLMDGDKEEALATADFTLDSLSEGTPSDLTMSNEQFIAVVTLTSNQDVSIDVDEAA